MARSQRRFDRKHKERKMRYIEIEKRLFDDILYKAWRATGAENEEELETSIRVIKKFKKEATPEKLTAEQTAQNLRADLLLNDPSARFAFEEDEWKLVLKKFRAGMQIFTSAVAEDVMDVLQLLKDPPSAETQNANP